MPDPKLVSVGEAWRFLAPSAEPVGDDWRLASYDDSSWSQSVSGFSVAGGEATSWSVPPLASIYLRSTFVVDNPKAIKWLTLRMDYSDGFVAYLNGHEISRRGMTGAPPTFDALALPHTHGPTEEIDVTAGINFLAAGSNVLAIQLHAAELPATNLVAVPELCANFQRGPFVQGIRATRADILWRTPVPASSIVEYGLTGNLEWSATITNLSSDHRMTLVGLMPGTNYFYRVRSAAAESEAVSAVYSFRTATTSGPVTFAVLGDSGSGWLPQLTLARRLTEANPDLVLHMGDTAYPSLNAYTADLHCLSVYAAQMREIPWYPAAGNHDFYSGSTHFLETFSPPTNSATGTGHFYSFDYGDVHFVCLFVPTLYPFTDTAPFVLGPGSTQLQWLTNDLASTAKPWRVLYLHNPLFTSAGHRADDTNANGIPDRLELQSWILPVASEHGVQLIFSGHDHSYERFAPIDGLHCFVTGGGGYTLYGLVERDRLSQRFDSRHHFLKVLINGDQATVEAIDGSGVVFDTATVPRVSPPQVRIDKSPSGGIQLSWNAEPGLDYSIESADHLAGPFSPFDYQGLPVTAVGHRASFELDTDLIDSIGQAVFLRVVALP